MELSGPGLSISGSTEDISASFRVSKEVVLPKYLTDTYWWAYLHPTGVRFFERQWIVNMILWGNFVDLRNAALAEIGSAISGDTLQLACVYGDFTQEVARRLSPGASLDVVDVAPVQLENLQRKLGVHTQVQLHHQDATSLSFADASYDNVVVFFLLHEQPTEARSRTVQEALRVARPGGKVIFMDYHEPSLVNPFRYVMIPILTALEPFALEMWRQEITDWIPRDMPIHGIRKETYFGGLYQKLVVTR
ncbi:MAG: class I SAM-dependent methyltransferase [Magnetococcales bacterium]|nr:class I SAM-dependent methyltransferase [Magnetococcales bacterium]